MSATSEDCRLEIIKLKRLAITNAIREAKIKVDKFNIEHELADTLSAAQKLEFELAKKERIEGGAPVAPVPKVHKLETLPRYPEDMFCGQKTFEIINNDSTSEIRNNDRDF